MGFKFEKNYTLTEEDQVKVSEFLKKVNQDLEEFEHIIRESPIDMSPFFEHELE